jgi:hypothetical protein
MILKAKLLDLLLALNPQHGLLGLELKAVLKTLK